MEKEVKYICIIKNSNEDTIRVYQDKEGNLYFNWDDFSQCCVMTAERKAIVAICEEEEVRTIRHNELERIAQKQIKAIREGEKKCWE